MKPITRRQAVQTLGTLPLAGFLPITTQAVEIPTEQKNIELLTKEVSSPSVKDCIRLNVNNFLSIEETFDFNNIIEWHKDYIKLMFRPALSLSNKALYQENLMQSLMNGNISWEVVRRGPILAGLFILHDNLPKRSTYQCHVEKISAQDQDLMYVVKLVMKENTENKKKV